MKKHRFLILAFLLLAAALGCSAQVDDEPPPVIKMQLVRIFDADPTEFVFVVNNTAFKSVDSLKGYLEALPAGSVIEWAPGCKRSGDEPLLSSDEEMNDFRKFCESRGIKFVLVPSG